jgi:LPXTG-motif cell wall-anchored protein
MENVGSHDLPAQLYFRDLLLRLRSSTTLSAAARSALTRISAWNGDVYYPYGADAATVLDPAATIFDQWFHDLEDTILRPVFQPAGPTPWTVNSFDDATTGPADGGRNEFNDNLEPVVLHAIQDVPAIPLHIDWLPAWATGPTRAARVDSLSAAVLERAVTELTTAFKTPDQTRWLEPTLKTTYMSLGAGSVPNEPFENRGVYGLLAAFPAPVALPSPTGAVRRGGGVLPATGGGNASGALGALALAGALFLRRRRRLQSRARATIAADPSAASKARIIASWWNDASKLPARSQIWPRT